MLTEKNIQEYMQTKHKQIIIVISKYLFEKSAFAHLFIFFSVFECLIFP